MKVILTGELKGQGGEGDVIEVSRGYTNNYLLPLGKAIMATPGNLRQLKVRRQHIEQREAFRLAEAQSYRELLDGKEISIAVKVSETGRLFGMVTPAIIAEAIQDQLGFEVDRHRIETHATIKTAGDHLITYSIYRDIIADLILHVIASVPDPVIA